MAAAVAVVAGRVDGDPPIVAADWERSSDSCLDEFLHGGREHGVSWLHRHLNRIEQVRGADEGADADCVIRRELISDGSDTAVSDANLHCVVGIGSGGQAEPCVGRHQDLARLHRGLLEPPQQRGREYVVRHHQRERLSSDHFARRKRREPDALAVPLVALVSHDRHSEAAAAAQFEHMPLDLIRSMARDHNDLVESRVPGAGDGTLDEAETPQLNERLRVAFASQPRFHTAGEHYEPSRLHRKADLLHP